MLRFNSSFLRFIKLCSLQFEYCYGFYSLKKLIKRPQLIVETTTSGSSPPPWHLLPDDILHAIFKNLCVGDRGRLRLVCKSWKRILTHDYIPKKLEAPWEILSDDSYNKPESRLEVIKFRSLSEQRVYSFRLPFGNQRCSLCGSSRGWLLMAVGPNINANMYLWQPISGDTKKLPPLSTLPFFDEYIELRMAGRIENLSTVVHRVEVFSMGSIDCIVAVIFRRNTCDEIAVCTPREKTWKILGGGDFKLRFSDIIFRSTCRQFWALVSRISPAGNVLNILSNYKQILLTDCRIPVGTVFVQVDDQNILGAQFPPGLQLAHTPKPIFHLVESPITQKLRVVIVWLDCFVSENNIDNEPIMRFRCQQTSQLMVSDVNAKTQWLDFLSSIGEEAIFLGAAGSFSYPIVEGIEADCIYFTIDDAAGIALHASANKQYGVRENGVFSLQHKKMQRTSFATVRFRSGSRVGWFMPQWK